MQKVPGDHEELSLGKPAPKKHTGLLVALIGVIIAVAAAWFLMDSLEEGENGGQRGGVAQNAPVSSSSPPGLPDTKLPSGPSSADPASAGPASGGSAAEGDGQHMPPIVGDTPPPATPAKSDAVVEPTFVEDLARWLVNGYQPARQGKGKISISLQEANMRYGVRMKGLRYAGRDVPAGRRDVLQYVFTPTTLSGLYGLYADAFMEAMAACADAPRSNGRKLTERQVSDMYGQYAGRLRSLAGVLEGLASMSPASITSKVKELHTLSENVAAADNRYGELAFLQEQARERGESGKAAEMKERAQRAAQSYQHAVIARERARQAFAASIKRNADAKKMADDNVIYVAQWVERRIQAGGAQFDAVGRAAEAIRDLAGRFSAASRG